jgi:hypothetical protein
VVVSNCVINLSAEKDRVLREAFTHDEAHEFLLGEGLDDLANRVAPLVAGKVMSAFVRANKPA